MDWLKNITVNLKATGPAAVLIALIVGITVLGIFGEGDKAGAALSILGFMAGALGIALAQRTGGE